MKTINAYAYGLTNRPPGLGAVPRGVLITPGTTRNAPDYSQTFRFGQIYYREPLDARDIAAYELRYNGTATLECSDPWDEGYEWRVVATVWDEVAF